MSRALSFAFGLLMVAAGALRGDQSTLAASVVGVLAVVVGVRFGAAATLAVLATIVALGLADPPPFLAAVAGLAAVGYLVLRHARGGAVLTTPTVVGAVGLSVVAGLGMAVPSTVPWVPLVAPLAVLLSYVTVVVPLFS